LYPDGSSGAVEADGLDFLPQPAYLSPAPDLRETWRKKRLGPEPHIGIIWTGKPLHNNDPARRRACLLKDLAPLAELQGVRFVSLQPRFGSPNGKSGDAFPEQLHDWGEAIEDFSDTAAAMSVLDHIITIDTAGAHLAGALGRPVSTLLPLAPDWRWYLDRDDSPWYPSMRLYRQQQPGCWQEPVAALTSDLADTLGVEVASGTAGDPA
ncbi:MAG: hypothetical protein HQL50_15375, partial [Magnetococcales bacterium]|nr:hypothetical protein [Magnetococcales bacterium]